MDVLLVGVKKTGKSTLARLLLKAARQRGRYTVVLDPLGYPQRLWGCDLVVSNLDHLDRVWRASLGLFVVVDEADTAIGMHPSKRHLELSTLGRHRDHHVAYVSHRYRTGLCPTIRDGCDALFAFCVSPEDGAAMASDYVDDALRSCHTLPKGSCFSKVKMGAPAARRVVFALKGIPNDVSQSAPVGLDRGQHAAPRTQLPPAGRAVTAGPPGADDVGPDGGPRGVAGAAQD